MDDSLTAYPRLKTRDLEKIIESGWQAICMAETPSPSTKTARKMGESKWKGTDVEKNPLHIYIMNRWSGPNGQKIKKSYFPPDPPS